MFHRKRSTPAAADLRSSVLRQTAEQRGGDLAGNLDKGRSRRRSISIFVPGKRDHARRQILYRPEDTRIGSSSIDPGQRRIRTADTGRDETLHDAVVVGAEHDVESHAPALHTVLR